MNLTCAICGRELPNKWAVAKRETVDGVERCYCSLHANDAFLAKKSTQSIKKGEPMDESNKPDAAAKEEAIVKSASGEMVRKAWAECTSLAGKLGGGVKSLWAKVQPDRSPEGMLITLNDSLSANKQRLDELKPELDRVYKEIVEKKKAYQSAPPARQRLLKTELQTLLSQYKSLEREFEILSENERSIVTVKGRFLEVLAYGLRGNLNAEMVDKLSDDIDDKAEDAEDVQDALAGLERAGKRKDRSSDDFDAELSGFDGELGFSETNTTDNSSKEKKDEQPQNADASSGRDPLADF